MLRALALIGALLAATAAYAQTRPIGGYIAPLGYCQLTSVASATAISTCSGGIPARAAYALICVDTANIRWRDDGTNPTASVGVPLSAGQCLQYQSNLSALSVIAQSGSPVVNISFYNGPPN